MLSEKLIKNLQTIIENTVYNYREFQKEVSNLYDHYNLHTPDKRGVSSSLSHQIEKSIIREIDLCQVGKGFEDILFNDKMMLEIKVASKPRLQISNSHKVLNKSYILVHHEDCHLKKIYILPFARDYYFNPPSKNSASRPFNYTKYKDLLIKLRY